MFLIIPSVMMDHNQLWQESWTLFQFCSQHAKTCSVWP